MVDFRRLLIYFLLAVRNDLERKYWAQIFPLRPHQMNLLINDICNSRCVMCMIWKNKRKIEITPDELLKILSDPLFTKIRFVGISGGEPTLRSDLPQLCDVVCQALPVVDLISITTNAINPDQVIERINQSIEICKTHKIRLGVMVSLDGVGEVHDLQRGRRGNFASALRVLRYYRNRLDVLSAGCTITKQNFWMVDELLEYCQQEGIYVRFRIADFINRLYNANEKEVIRNFSLEESYHLALFFQRLELKYEKHPEVRRTYRSIRKMLLGEAGRTSGCPYQSRAVMIDSRGDIKYCAPKSAVIGNALEKSASTTWKGKLTERRRILKQECMDCIHDYHSDPTMGELLSSLSIVGWRRILSLDVANRIFNIRSDKTD